MEAESPSSSSSSSSSSPSFFIVIRRGRSRREQVERASARSESLAVRWVGGWVGEVGGIGGESFSEVGVTACLGGWMGGWVG